MNRFLLDCRVMEFQQLSAILGLNPFDEEQYNSESEESAERCARVSPLLPLVGLLSSALSSSVVEYLNITKEPDIEIEDIDAIADLINQISVANAVGALTTLEDLGVISYNYGA